MTADEHSPRVLLVGLLPGLGGMHLPRHLARVGLQLAFLGSETCMASRSGLVKTRWAWEGDGRRYDLRPFADAVKAFRPDWVVPIDELASACLQQIGRGAFSDDSVRLVRRSLGQPAGYGILSARRHAYRIAQEAGVVTPRQADIPDAGHLREFAAGHGYPVVLKREQSMGGAAVFILDDEAAVERVCREQRVGATGGGWLAQSHVPGDLGMHAVFADAGKVLAEVSAIQLRRRSERRTAPSSVVGLRSHSGMASACAAFVATAGLSGFHGWDFQIDSQGQAVMIEHNPRPISISHLGGLGGSDLCAALARLLGQPVDADPAPAIPERVVALFPDEWRRDPRSAALHESFHDAPWDDPALFAEVLNNGGRFV